MNPASKGFIIIKTCIIFPTMIALLGWVVATAQTEKDFEFSKRHTSWCADVKSKVFV